MAFENPSATNSIGEVVDSIGENEKPLDKEKLIRLCWEIFFAKDSPVRRPISKNLNYIHDFGDWLRVADSKTKRSRVDDLIATLSRSFSDKKLKSADEKLRQAEQAEKLKKEIIRWLNQNLPS